jgi:glucose/mannose-6-phosphate isomerase
MGGSATAGDYFAALCERSSELPVTVVRGYELPQYVSDRTLVVVSSYSGNTEETLSCYDDAWKRGSYLLATTTGGAVAERAAVDGVPVYRIAYKSAPRAALAHGLAPLLRLGQRLDLFHCEPDAVRKAAALHDSLVTNKLGPAVPAARNPAKQLAEALHGKLPLILSADHLATVASRFKNQLAENGKALAAVDSMPEANHNLVVGLGTARELAGSVALVTLESALYDRRIERRFEVTSELFEEAGVSVHRIMVEGSTRLEQLIAGTAWGDFVSCYLALLHGVDPTPVPQIDRLKAALGA